MKSMRNAKRGKHARRGDTAAHWYVEAVDKPARGGGADDRLAAWLERDDDNADALARCEAAVQITRHLATDDEVGRAFREAAQLARARTRRQPGAAGRWLRNPAFAWTVAGACAALAAFAFATRSPLNVTGAEAVPAGSAQADLSLALASTQPVVALPGDVIVDAHSVAILPFATRLAPAGDDPAASDRLAERLHEEVVSALAANPGIYAATRDSVLPYAALELTVPELAIQLGVRAVGDGAIVRQDGRVRVSLRLTDAITGAFLVKATYERPVGELDVLRDEMATSIAAALAHSSPPGLAAVNDQGEIE